MSYLDKINIGFKKQTPLVLQIESTECGLACIAMVAAHYGQHHSLSNLRSRFGSSLKGVTLKDVISVADSVGFASRPLRLELTEIRLLKNPCILHWDLCHFVVLLEARKNQIVILDPSVGKRTLTISEFSQHFTGVALELTPNADFSKMDKPPKVRISQLFGHFIGVKRTFLYLIGMALVIEVLGLIRVC